MNKKGGGIVTDITMLGVGNGFSKGIYDNNALVEQGGKRALIDCGITAWRSLEELEIHRDTIDDIFITHLHFDHSGGVESAALYGAYMVLKKQSLIIPKPIKQRFWDCCLKGTIEDKEKGLVTLEDYFAVKTPEEGEVFDLGGVKAYWVRTHHVPGKFSCGLVLEDFLFYTSDMVCDRIMLETMVNKGVQVIFHDCQLENARVHGDFKTLCTYPGELQKKIKLMHHGLGENDSRPDAGEMQFLFQHKRYALSQSQCHSFKL